jgi:hypothetical protein
MGPSLEKEGPHVAEYYADDGKGDVNAVMVVHKRYSFLMKVNEQHVEGICRPDLSKECRLTARGKGLSRIP